MSRLIIGAGVLLLAGGCARDGLTIDATHYDQRCAQASDCVLVYSGQACPTCGGCSNSAISATAQAEYEADRRATLCPPRPGNVACGPCLDAVAECDAGTCTARLF